MRRISNCIAAVVGASVLGFASAVAQTPETRELFDLTLVPPTINTDPGREYADDRRNMNMVIGMDRSPGGRIWACWVSGGDILAGKFQSPDARPKILVNKARGEKPSPP